MSQCQRCAGRAQLFLCSTCSNELREMLKGLAHGQKLAGGKFGSGWIENLQDAVLGRTRLGESARRSSDRTTPLMVHLDASKLLDQVHATLIRWVQGICETRGIDCPALRFYPRDFIGPLPPDGYRGHAGDTRSAAIWLAKHVNAIACDESAGMCYREIKDVIDAIERMINRPESDYVTCGPCPAMLADNYGQRKCNTALTAARDDAEIQCPECGTTHNVEQLRRHLWTGVDKWLLTYYELKLVIAAYGDPIPERTLRHWRATDKLKPRGYRGESPAYWLADVHELRNDKAEVA